MLGNSILVAEHSSIFIIEHHFYPFYPVLSPAGEILAKTEINNEGLNGWTEQQSFSELIGFLLSTENKYK